MRAEAGGYVRTGVDAHQPLTILIFLGRVTSFFSSYGPSASPFNCDCYSLGSGLPANPRLDPALLARRILLYQAA